MQGIPTTLRYKDVVSQAIRNINLTRIEDFIQTFSDFHNRYLNGTTGVESQKYLLSQVNASIQGYPGSISVIEFEHSDWLQNSIIVRIDGADPTLRSELVILGAHQDSINTNGATLRAPGTKKTLAFSNKIIKMKCLVKWKASCEQVLMTMLADASLF